MRPTKADQVAHEVLISLAQWKPYIYYEAATGSVYIKFPHWKLGSLRIGDHNGREKYSYRWRVRLDKSPNYFGKGVHNGVSFTECGIEMIDSLVKEFNRQAEFRNVKPGDKAYF